MTTEVTLSTQSTERALIDGLFHDPQTLADVRDLVDAGMFINEANAAFFAAAEALDDAAATSIPTRSGTRCNGSSGFRLTRLNHSCRRFPTVRLPRPRFPTWRGRCASLRCCEGLSRSALRSNNGRPAAKMLLR